MCGGQRMSRDCMKKSGNVVLQRTVITDSVRLVCVKRVYVTVGCPSVRLSGRSIASKQQRRAAGLPRAADIDQCLLTAPEFGMRPASMIDPRNEARGRLVLPRECDQLNSTGGYGRSLGVNASHVRINILTQLTLSLCNFF